MSITVFHELHDSLCSLRGEENLNEMAVELAYENIVQSEFFETWQNDVCDAKAEELAAFINTAIENWFAKEQA